MLEKDIDGKHLGITFKSIRNLCAINVTWLDLYYEPRNNINPVKIMIIELENP